MRETRFRVWNIKLKKMFYLESNDVQHNHYLQIGGSDFWLYHSLDGKLIACSKDGDILMQYSNWHDVTKKRIWENDVLNIVNEDGELMTVICKLGFINREMLTSYEVEINGFYFLRIDDNFESLPILENHEGKHDCEIMTIIGNIYENPELIKKD